MLSRESLEGMVASLDTETLLKALSSAGVNVGEGGGMGMGSEAMMDELSMPEGMERHKSWGDQTVMVGDSPVKQGVPVHSPEIYAAAARERQAPLNQAPNPRPLVNEPVPPGEEDFFNAAY